MADTLACVFVHVQMRNNEYWTFPYFNIGSSHMGKSKIAVTVPLLYTVNTAKHCGP